MRLAIVRPLFGAMSMLMVFSVAHAAGRATVRGAEAVNVRRAPSPDSPSLATLARGASVKVERVEDGWAVVTLESGREGYVKAAFLNLPPGIEVVALPPTVAALAPTFSPAALAAEAAISPAPASTPEVRAGGALLPTVTRSADSQELGPSLALAGIGVVLGLVIGAAYGRRQERNRRSRVRFK